MGSRTTQRTTQILLCAFLAQAIETSAIAQTHYGMDQLSRSSRPSFIPPPPQAAQQPPKLAAKNPKLPACNAPEVVAYFKHMIADSPMGRQKLLEAYSVDALTYEAVYGNEYAVVDNRNPNGRMCFAKINTNAGIQSYNFDLTMKGPNLDKVEIDATPLDN